MPGETSPTEDRGSNLGWVVAGIVLLVVFAAAAGLWFSFHP
jgi:hypothetical protein